MFHCLSAGDDVLAAAATHVHSILHQFNQQNLALTLWAFAKLAWCPPTDLLSDAASLAVASLHTSNSQNLSNTLWAFATLGFMPQAGLLEVCCCTCRCISNYMPMSAFHDAFVLCIQQHMMNGIIAYHNGTPELMLLLKSVKVE